MWLMLVRIHKPSIQYVHLDCKKSDMGSSTNRPCQLNICSACKKNRISMVFNGLEVGAKGSQRSFRSSSSV